MQLFKGFGNTLQLFVLTLVFSLPLGLLVAFGRMSKFAPLSFLIKNKEVSPIISKICNFRPIAAVTSFFISILRGTPLMLQLIVWCFGPYYLFGISISPSWRSLSLVLGFVINYAAYFAEIYRSGLQSISIGQHEAAAVLGYSKGTTFFKIILPQMIKCVLPSVTNEIITLVKDTSLAYILSYIEMFTLAQQIAAAGTSFMPLFVAGVFYYVFNAIIAFVMGRVERKLSYYR